MLEIVLSPQIHVQQNFRIFWVGMHFRGNVDDILYTFLPIPSGHIIFIISLHKNLDKKYYTGFTT